jgi:hypothetical protein
MLLGHITVGLDGFGKGVLESHVNFMKETVLHPDNHDAHAVIGRENGWNQRR